MLFVVLDGYYIPPASCPSIPETQGNTLNAAQLQFLADTLAQSSAKAKFVFVHNPTFLPTNKDYNKCTDDAMCQFWQIINNSNVLAVFNGHAHLYSRVVVDSSFLNPGYNFTRPVPQVIAGTCGAPITDYTPGCDTSDEPGTIYAPPSWHTIPRYNYAVVDVDISGATTRMTINSYCGDLAGNWRSCDSFPGSPSGPAGDLLLLSH